MKCEECDTLMYLSLDGRLDGEQEKRFREHLAGCTRCSEKLAFLDATEEKARAIEPEEPPREYWNTFSGRVISKIESGRERTPAFVLKKILGGIFSMPPAKLRIAAGVVSAAVVVVVAILYINQRGGDIVPPRMVEQTERQPATVPPTEEGDSGERGGKGAPAELGKAEKKQRSEEVLPKEVFEEEKEKRAMAAAPVSEKDEERTERRDARIPAVGKTPDKTGAYLDKTRGKPSMAEETEALHMAAEEHFDLDGTVVPRISEADTLMPGSVLRTLVETWNSFIERNPRDALARRGYEQSATGYYLLARLGARDSDIAEGVERIEEYAGRTVDPALKNILLDKLQKIRALRKK